MSKLVVLKDWINPCFLENNKVYSPEQLVESVVFDDFFNPERLLQIEHFLLFEAKFDDICLIYKDGIKHKVTVREWDLAPLNERFSFKSVVAGVKDEFVDSPNYRCYLELCGLFASPAFIALLALYTKEIYATTVMARRMRQESLLTAHNDCLPGWRLNLVCYFSSGWQPGFGGELTLLQGEKQSSQIADLENAKEIHRIEPIFNRLVLFKPTQGYFHQVEHLTPQSEDWQRLCFVVRCMDPRSLK